MITQKTDLQSQNSERVPFWRKRWLWAVVVGGVTMILTSVICLYLNVSLKDYIIFLPAGLVLFISMISFGFLHFLFLSVTTSFPSIKFIFVCFVYYAAIILLLYLIFKNKYVKIRYPILYFLMLGISIVGYYFLIKALSNF